ncbi:MAG: ParA family protein [Gammaproteobacteria bacterium]|nr:ParA family protein [Gammaproteobacteria bacterium]
MNIWAIANQKGGVGKTTTTITLGGFMAAAGEQTLLIDLDPHCSLSTYLGIDTDKDERSAYTLFKQVADGDEPQTHSQIANTRFDNLHVLPASTAMATLDRQLGSRAGMGTVIARSLEGLDMEYQNVLIDCPPMLGILMVNALAASERLIIPVQTEFLALKGLDRMLRTLEMIQHACKRQLQHVIVPTMYDRRTRASIDTLKVLQERYTGTLWESVIPVDTQFREASQAGVPLSINMPRSHGALAYEALLNTLQKTTGEALNMAVAS